ncbi:MAG: hypothetical protein NVS4B11_36340 [Ktedonobacteraceae bacterium]
MADDLMEVENDLRSVSQEKCRIEESITDFQQHIRNDEIWLTTHTRAASDYQEKLEELLALQAYLSELHAQVASLDEIVLELTREQEYWRHPELLLAS